HVLQAVHGNEELFHRNLCQECHRDPDAISRREVNILVPNLGSTSLKYQVLAMPAERVLAKGKLERVQDYRQAIRQIKTDGAKIDAVAFKAVHAGPRYRGTFLIDDDVVHALE